MKTTVDCGKGNHTGYKFTYATAQACAKCGVYAKARSFADYVAPPSRPENGASHQVEDGHYY